MAEIVFSVSQLNEYISKKLIKDPFLGAVAVVGEVTNFSMSSIGHAFFSLKDAESMASCIVYGFSANEYKDTIADGALIKVQGRIVYYKKSGQIQLAVEKAALQGVGDLYARFEQTKQKLYKEGLFDVAHKKPLPAFPLRLGVVTSAAGAALHDIINVATRRFDGIGITVYPAQVQGHAAARQICRGIEFFNATKSVDVIIVGRGGGSFEDLFAFNEECVARAVYESDIPVVSAVGHETDYSLCDMAADLRAPTPSAAAELVVRDKRAVIDYLKEYKIRLYQNLEAVLQRYEKRTDMLAGNIKAYPFRIKLEQTRGSIVSIYEIMKKSLMGMLEMNTVVLEKYISGLESLNPKNVLQRGYAIVYDENNVVITSRAATSAHMDIEFRDGRVAVIRKDECDG
ncbi:MAG: exodeoxyribonuclease VII large subunit [Eubacteriales bacterium]|nr:exodeoxyribonuclease VII large subunit [Eubacteriales bacterium]